MLRPCCSLPPICHIPRTYTNQKVSTAVAFVSCQFKSCFDRRYQTLELKLASLPPWCDSLSSLGYKRNHCCHRKNLQLTVCLPLSAFFHCIMAALMRKEILLLSFFKDRTNVFSTLSSLTTNHVWLFLIAHKTGLDFCCIFLTVPGNHWFLFTDFSKTLN